jgi:DNA-binding transcriptional MocR family regulator
MHRLQEVVRLCRMGQSARVIARRLGIGRNTIKRYLEVLERDGLLEGGIDELPEVDVLRACIDGRLPAKSAPQQASSIEHWLERIQELHATAGPTAIHSFLKLNEPDFAGSLSAVKRVCRRLDRERGPAAEDVAIPPRLLRARSRRWTSSTRGCASTPSAECCARAGSS